MKTLSSEKTITTDGHSSAQIELPILTYHNILDDYRNDQKTRRSPHGITASQFQMQMEYLYENNYKTLALNELLNLTRKGGNQDYPESNKIVVITFDDGYQNNYIHAFPILRRCQLNATFFVIVNRIGSPNYLTWDQLREMSKENMCIQSHTLSHTPLETIPLFSVEQELLASKNILEQSLKKPICCLSFPHGAYNDGIIDIVKKVGYAGSCTSDIGYFNTGENPFKINRINIRRNYELTHFRRIVQKDYVFLRRIKLIQNSKKRIQDIIGIDYYNKLHRKIFDIPEFEN